MDRVRAFLMNKMPLMITCEQADEFIDAYLAGELSGNQRRLFKWHINLCAECGQYLEEYQQSISLGKSQFYNESNTKNLEVPEGIVQAILAAQYQDPNMNFDIFRSSLPFRGLPMADLRRIFSNGEILEVDDGATVIQQDNVNTALYVVLSGAFEVSLSTRQEPYSEVQIAIRRPPDCFGEYTFVDHKLASANVRATEKSKLFKIQFDVLNGLIESDAEMGRTIYKNILLLVIDRLRANEAELDLFRL